MINGVNLTNYEYDAAIRALGHFKNKKRDYEKQPLAIKAYVNSVNKGDNKLHGLEWMETFKDFTSEELTQSFKLYRRFLVEYEAKKQEVAENALRLQKHKNNLKTALSIAIIVSSVATLTAIVAYNDANSYTNTATLKYYTCLNDTPQFECAKVWGTPEENQLSALGPQHVGNIAIITSVIGWILVIMLFISVND